MCFAGAVALDGVKSQFEGVQFENNTSPSQAGALSSTFHTDLVDTHFKNNSALIYGTAKLLSVEAVNTSFSFPDDTVALQAQFGNGSRGF